MAQPAARQKSKILVIDDSFMLRKSLIDQLTGDRFDVFEAKDGPTGLAMAAEVNPDVILLDYVMPGMNGYEVYQRLREQPKFANTPVIVISSSYDEVVKKFGYPFEGFNFLHKQFTRDQLEEYINAVLPMIVPEEGGGSVTIPAGGNFSVPDIAALMARLGQLETQLANFNQASQLVGKTEGVLERLSSLEGSLTAPPQSSQDLFQQVSALDSHLQKVINHSTEALQRLGSLEQRVQESGTGGGDNQAVLQQLSTLEERVRSLATLSATSQKLNQKVASTLATFSPEQITSRLDRLEQGLTASGSTRSGASAPFWLALLVTTAIAALIGAWIGSLAKGGGSTDQSNHLTHPVSQRLS